MSVVSIYSIKTRSYSLGIKSQSVRMYPGHDSREGRCVPIGWPLCPSVKIDSARYSWSESHLLTQLQPLLQTSVILSIEHRLGMSTSQIPRVTCNSNISLGTPTYRHVESDRPKADLLI